jgi:glyoxylase-like metal-dependent hydrolase (beta-lactamase superfamily II)
MNAPEPGVAQDIATGLRLVLAPNPGPMTHWGTNTFLLGEGEVAVVDPGPADPRHLAAILKATAGERVTHILVTHAHADHSALAGELSRRTGAPVHGFGPPDAGRSEVMTRIAAEGLVGGGEGVDRDFRPDRTVGDGDRIDGAGWSVEVLHTPGHFAGHLAFRWGDTLLSGDHVMDWSSSLVSPPDGDIAAFMSTCHRLRDLGAGRLLPGHGGAIEDPGARLDWLISHRRAREAAILEQLSSDPEPIRAIAERVYTDIPAAMLPAAERNVFAHLIDLVVRSLAVAEPSLSADARYRRA